MVNLKMGQMSCKLCGHAMTRGVSQLNYHLVKIPGHDVGFVVNQSYILCGWPMILFMRRIERRKRQLLTNLKFLPVESLDPQEP